MNKYKKHNRPKSRKYGALKRRCIMCGQTHAHIQKYRIKMCRKCFRDYAKKIGFKKYS